MILVGARCSIPVHHPVQLVVDLVAEAFDPVPDLGPAPEDLAHPPVGELAGHREDRRAEQDRDASPGCRGAPGRPRPPAAPPSRPAGPRPAARAGAAGGAAAAARGCLPVIMSRLAQALLVQAIFHRAEGFAGSIPDLSGAHTASSSRLTNRTDGVQNIFAVLRTNLNKAQTARKPRIGHARRSRETEVPAVPAGRGHRVTSERLALFDEIFAQHGHIDAEELLGAMKARVAQDLARHRLPQPRPAGRVRPGAQAAAGRNRFLYEHVHAGQRHDHLVCTGCGRVVEFVSPGIAALQAEICRAHGFSTPSTPCRSAVSATPARRSVRRRPSAARAARADSCHA